MKKLNFTVIMSFIHLIFFLSIFFFLTVICSATILLLPALASAFDIGKDVFFGKYNVYESLSARFFKGIKEQIKMLRYLPLQLLMLLQIGGIYLLSGFASGMAFAQPFSYAMLACAAFIFTILIYLAAYHVFYSPLPKIIEVIIAMFYKLYYLLIVWVASILLLCFASVTLGIILLLCGEILLLAFEAIAYIDIMFYKKLRGELTDEEKEHCSFLYGRKKEQ